MATTTTTPLMNLVLPVVGSQVGPTWATNLNTAFDVIDTHDHTTGKGSKIPISGLNINADLNLSDKGVYNVGYSRHTNLTSPLSAVTYPTTINTAAGELYYNDAAGNQIQLTSMGGINLASLGTIGGDYSTSTASLAYASISSLFTFTSSAGVYAKINTGDLKIYERVSSGKSVEIKTITGLGADYTLTLPAAVPLSTLPVKMASTGALSTSQIATADIANSAVGSTQIANDAVTTAKLANGAVTLGKQAIVNKASNGNGSSYTTTTATNEDITGTDFTLTVQGRTDGAVDGLVHVMLIPQNAGLDSNITIDTGSGTVASGVLSFTRDGGTGIGYFNFGIFPTAIVGGTITYPLSMFHTVVTMPVGAHSLKASIENLGNGAITLSNYKLFAYEV